jgi:hypothetical protein
VGLRVAQNAGISWLDERLQSSQEEPVIRKHIRTTVMLRLLLLLNVIQNKSLTNLAYTFKDSTSTTTENFRILRKVALVSIYLRRSHKRHVGITDGSEFVQMYERSMNLH